MNFNTEQLNSCIHSSGLSFTVTDDCLESDFVSLGFDSLDVFSLLSEVESTTGVSIDDDDINMITSPSKLIDFVNLNIS